MPIDIIMPALSAGMEAGTLAKWLKAEGDSVAAGEAIAEIEIDKATMELEAPAAGRMGPSLIAEGRTEVAVGTLLAHLLAEGEAAPAPAAVVTAFPARAKVSAPQPLRLLVSPLARRLAQAGNVNLADLTGSGPRGRIVRLDVLRATATLAASESAPAASAPEHVPRQHLLPASVTLPIASADHSAVPHSLIRKTIAHRLTESKTTIPHFYLHAECEIDALLALRGQINADRTPQDRVSINDLVVKASALALRRVPEANVIWTPEATLHLHPVDIAVAVATDGGLITPILRHADEKSLGTVSKEIKALAERARAGRLKPDEYQGGGFSVSNLGMYGVSAFQAIINPPQSAILAVGAALRKPVGRGDAIVLASVMSCTLSVDHRVIDGAVAAQWLGAFQALLQKPLDLLM